MTRTTTTPHELVTAQTPPPILGQFKNALTHNLDVFNDWYNQRYRNKRMGSSLSPDALVDQHVHAIHGIIHDSNNTALDIHQQLSLYLKAMTPWRISVMFHPMRVRSLRKLADSLQQVLRVNYYSAENVRQLTMAYRRNRAAFEFQVELPTNDDCTEEAIQLKGMVKQLHSLQQDNVNTRSENAKLLKMVKRLQEDLHVLKSGSSINPGFSTDTDSNCSSEVSQDSPLDRTDQDFLSVEYELPVPSIKPNDPQQKTDNTTDVKQLTSHTTAIISSLTQNPVTAKYNVEEKLTTEPSQTSAVESRVKHQLSTSSSTIRQLLGTQKVSSQDVATSMVSQLSLGLNNKLDEAQKLAKQSQEVVKVVANASRYVKVQS